MGQFLSLSIIWAALIATLFAVPSMNFGFTRPKQSFRKQLHDLLVHGMSPSYEIVMDVCSNKQYRFGNALTRKLDATNCLTENAGDGKPAIDPASLIKISQQHEY